jgi:hypothetical protein
MAKLTNETLTVIFNLLRQLAEAVEDASATEWLLFERFGETERTIAELDELQSARERQRVSYSRLYSILLTILEAQPIASNDMLDLLARAIEQAQANLAGTSASVREIKEVWNLP